jgi:hypothetical protein
MKFPRFVPLAAIGFAMAILPVMSLPAQEVVPTATPESTAAPVERPARARFAHFALDAPPIRLVLNGQTLSELTNLQQFVPSRFGDISSYTDIPPFTVPVTVAMIADGAEANDLLTPSVEFTVQPGHDYTIALVGTAADESLEVLVIDETAALADFNLAQSGVLIVVHGVRGLPEAAVVRAGEALIDDLEYGRFAVIDADESASIEITPHDDLSAPLLTLAGALPANVIALQAVVGVYDRAAIDDYTLLEARAYLGDLVILDGGAITLGQPVDVALAEAGRRVRYTLTLEANTLLNITLRGGPGTDAMLYLYDAAGELISSVDELSFFDDTFDAGWTNFDLEAGVYGIEAGGWNDAYPGDYVLLVEPVE